MTAELSTVTTEIDDDRPPLRGVLREHTLTIYPMVALGLLGVVDSFQGYAFSVLTPEISRALGLSLAAVAGARTLAFLAAILAPLPIAALSSNRRRAMLCLTTGIVWSIITLLTGFVTSLFGLIAVLVLDGLSTGSVGALHAPLLVDSYPAQARVRVLSGYQGLLAAGQVVSPLFVAVLAGPLDLTWRGVFLVMGLTSLATTLLALGLRDPAPGQFDAVADTASDEPSEGSDTLGFFEIVRRLLLIPTVKRLAVGNLVIGILLIPFATFLSEFLEQRWGLSPGERGAFFAGISAASVVALLAYGGRAETAFRRDPAKLLGFSGLALAAAVLAIGGGALMPTFVLMCVFFGVGQSLVAVISPGLTISLMSIVDARYRSHAAAVIGIFTASGSILGVLFLAGIDRRFGVGGSIVSLVFPGVIGSLIIASARKLIVADMDKLADDIREAQDVSTTRRAGGHVPLLACRGIDFSYGRLQVLFDVDFAVDEGEMVALLGTNGAGKSTLLKVISGIGLPRNGTVRHHGQDITYLDAERRVRLGITQIPGGRAVFGSMDVVENLRAFGYTLGRDPQAPRNSHRRVHGDVPAPSRTTRFAGSHVVRRRAADVGAFESLDLAAPIVAH